MWKRLAEIERRYQEVERLLGDPEILSQPAIYHKYAKEHADLEDLVQAYRSYEQVRGEIEEGQELLRGDDEELKTLVKEELPALKEKKSALEEELKRLLLPRDPNDNRNVLLEIRAGTGGDEAALFVADLFRMYARYAEMQGWRVEVVSTSPSGGVGGFKEVVALIEGNGAFSRLKYESGVHRVQRVPVTEAQGRVHTSAVTVAIMPEAETWKWRLTPRIYGSMFSIQVGMEDKA